eukprot:2727129-Pyramimonas_sp.AAC.1
MSGSPSMCMSLSWMSAVSAAPEPPPTGSGEALVTRAACCDTGRSTLSGPSARPCPSQGTTPSTPGCSWARWLGARFSLAHRGWDPRPGTGCSIALGGV